MQKADLSSDTKQSEPSGLSRKLTAIGHDLVALAGALLGDERGKLFPGPDAEKHHFAQVAEQLFRERRRRDDFFPPSLFREPAWDILLDLYIASQRGRRVATGDPALISGIPLTTALRWYRLFEEQGLIERVPDKADRRRVFLRLTAEGEEKMTRYLISFHP